MMPTGNARLTAVSNSVLVQVVESRECLASHNLGGLSRKSVI